MLAQVQINSNIQAKDFNVFKLIFKVKKLNKLKSKIQKSQNHFMEDVTREMREHAEAGFHKVIIVLEFSYIN